MATTRQKSLKILLTKRFGLGFYGRRITSVLLGPRNCINLSLGRFVQLQSLAQVHAPLHYCWILVQQFRQLLTLTNMNINLPTNSFPS
ncbi:hypothetical protein Hanom_Chr03g00279501 [Helianthus anomalus]